MDLTWQSFWLTKATRCMESSAEPAPSTPDALSTSMQTQSPTKRAKWFCTMEIWQTAVAWEKLSASRDPLKFTTWQRKATSRYSLHNYTHTILIMNMNSMSLGFIWLEWVYSWGGRPWHLKAAGCNQDVWAREASEILSSVYIRTLWQGTGNPSEGNNAFLSKIALWLVKICII